MKPMSQKYPPEESLVQSPEESKENSMEELAQLRSEVDDLRSELARIKNVQRDIVEATYSTIGEDFFRLLIRYLSSTLGVRYVFVGELADRGNSLQTIALWSGNGFSDNIRYNLSGTPCADAVDNEPCFYPSGVKERFHDNHIFRDMEVESYYGIPLKSAYGQMLGLIVVMDDKPMEMKESIKEVLRFAALRACTELDRRHVEKEIEVHAEQQQTVAELGQLALSGAGLKALMDEAAGCVARTLQVEYAKILKLLPQEEQSLLLVAGSGWEKGLVGNATISAGESSQAGYTLTSRSPVTVDDFKEEERFEAPALLSDHYVKSGISVVIQGSDGPYGVFGAHSVKPRLFTREEVNYLQSVTNIIAQAIERKRAEEQLASEREHLSIMLRSIVEGVITTDTEKNILIMNKAAVALTGVSLDEAIGKPLSDIYNVIDEKSKEVCGNPVDKALRMSGTVELARNRTLISTDQVERMIEDTAAPIMDDKGKILGAVLVFRDITEKKRMEEEMIKATKLESLGLLAGGIAHDFNNILTGIVSSIALASEAADPDSEICNRLSALEKVALQARGLTQQLLTFSKGGAPVTKLSSIGDLIEQSANFVLSGAKVGHEFKIVPDLKACEIDQGQISQVINNLLINACQAMPEGQSGGVISVGAVNVEVKENSALSLVPGLYVDITVRDNGTGIDKETLLKIFDPYFTTKADGNGLGLAASYSIVKNHDGYLDVESELGKGTTFHIYLPATDKMPEHPDTEVQEQIQAQTEQTAPIASSGAEKNKVVSGGKVLVMDDDMLIRMLAGEILNLYGYEVDFASEGGEALEIYKQAKEEGEPFDVLLMDLTIRGGMGGKETIKRLLEYDPGVRAIVSSGYTTDPIMRNYKEYGFSGMMIKPYSKADLLDTLKLVMNNL